MLYFAVSPFHVRPFALEIETGYTFEVPRFVRINTKPFSAPSGTRTVILFSVQTSTSLSTEFTSMKFAGSSSARVETEAILVKKTADPSSGSPKWSPETMRGLPIWAFVVGCILEMTGCMLGMGADFDISGIFDASASMRGLESPNLVWMRTMAVSTPCGMRIEMS